MDPLAGNQRAYRLTDYDACSISACSWAAGGICRRVAARGNRTAIPGCGRRAWRAIFGSEAAHANGVCAAGFTHGAQTWAASFAGTWTLDHRSGGCSLDARRLYENESGQDVCGCRFSDERLDAASALRGDSPDYESCARSEGK